RLMRNSSKMDTEEAFQPRRRRLLAGIVLAACGLAAGGAWSYRHWFSIPAIVKGPMVQKLDENGFTLVWETGPGRQTLARIIRPSLAEVTVGTPVGPMGRRHIVRFAGLAPGMPYNYQIMCGDKVLTEHSVRTGPPRSATFRVIAFGDSGSGEP